MFYHGSKKELEIGLCLYAQVDGYVQTTEEQDLEELMESCRPEDKISRNDAVYFTTDIDMIDSLGGYSDYVYKVEPIGDYSKHDLAWYSEAGIWISNRDMKKAKEAAINYWNGTPFKSEKHSAYEYLCEEAEILEAV